jgi:hypothetical protein
VNECKCECATHPEGGCSCDCDENCPDGLRSEVARLTAERNDAMARLAEQDFALHDAEAKVEGLREALRDLLGSHAAIYRAGAAFHETLPVVMKARALLPSDAARDAGEGAKP